MARVPEEARCDEAARVLGRDQGGLGVAEEAVLGRLELPLLVVGHELDAEEADEGRGGNRVEDRELGGVGVGAEGDVGGQDDRRGR